MRINVGHLVGWLLLLPFGLAPIVIMVKEDSHIVAILVASVIFGGLWLGPMLKTTLEGRPHE